MPAKSKAQQKFMGIVRSIQKGEQPASKFSKKAQDAAKDMKKKDAEDFASTKHKGLPKKVKEAFLSENPAASAAAAMVMMQMQNPDTGKKIKAITPLKNKDHKLHGKAKGIFKRLKDKFSKKKDKPVDKVAQYRALMQKEVEEGFGGDLKGSDKKKFEKARKENAEQLGYELTGTSDIKESVNEDGHTDVASAKRKLKTSVEDIKDIYSKLKGMSDEESLPSWWTDKITLSSNYLDKARDFIMNPTESVNEGKKAVGDFHQIENGIRKAIEGMQGLRKKIDDAPYNPKWGKFTDILYKREIDLVKFLGRGYPQLRNVAKDKVLESVNEKVIKVSKKDDVPGNPMKMKGEEKIKKLAWSGSVGMKKPGSYEIKGNKLNVNNIRPRDKGFFVRHFTMGTGFRKANLYYDGVHWQGKKKF